MRYFLTKGSWEVWRTEVSDVAWKVPEAFTDWCLLGCHWATYPFTYPSSTQHPPTPQALT